jgi:hypothetical protein
VNDALKFPLGQVVVTTGYCCIKWLVGEEEVKESKEINGIYECAGANAALTLNGNFGGRPHLPYSLKSPAAS